MARTYRTKRPRMRLGGRLGRKQHRNGKVRDGTPTHAAPSCRHHGGCPYCESSRMHGNRRRAPVLDRG